MTNTHKHSRRLTTRREEVRRQNPVSGTNETQSPSTHRRPEKTQTKEGDRSPDQTRPPDPQRRPTDPPESALTSNYRSIGGLEVDGAAEFGALRRLRRRPRRQPAVSATARACPLLQTRPHPPPRPRAAASAAARGSVQLQPESSCCFSSIFGSFSGSRGYVAPPRLARQCSCDRTRSFDIVVSHHAKFRAHH